MTVKPATKAGKKDGSEHLKTRGQIVFLSKGE